MTNEGVDECNLNELYYNVESLYDKINNSSLDTNSDEFQEMIRKCRTGLENLTIMVSQIGVFSSNEGIDELPTDSVKFLLLPFMLGNITLKRKSMHTLPTETSNSTNEDDSKETVPNHATLLRISKIYFKDYLSRCIDYGVTTAEIPQEKESSAAAQPNSSAGARPTPQQIQQWSREREDKIKRYKQKKSLDEKLEELRKYLKTADEEKQREYYCNAVSLAVINSIEEMESILKEESMLKQMAALKMTPDQLRQPPVKSAALKPLLITKDAVQKKVFGAGYPSLPIMSVDEFYEKRVQEGRFPGGCNPSQGGAGTGGAAGGQEAGENGDEVESGDEEGVERERRRLQARDEFRDTHKRGEGNRYNRS